MLCIVWVQFSAMHRTRLSGEQEVHLRRSFAARCVLEDDPNPVDVKLGSGFGDLFGRGDQTRSGPRNNLAETRIDMAQRTRCQQRPEHITRPATHRRACDHVFADRLAQEPIWRDDANIAGVHRLLSGDTMDPAEVIGVAVCIDHSLNLPMAKHIVGQFKASRRSCSGCQNINDQPTVVARYQRHIRDVVAADLPNAVGHFEQTMNGVELTLTPEGSDLPRVEQACLPR